MKAKQEHSGATTVTRNGYTMGRSAETAENEIGGEDSRNTSLPANGELSGGVGRRSL